MRLKKIKLAGFKSFVDATTVSFPSNLVGVVGPNGCGKSNIIDAVRWVMGESSAKHLRSESMADVIFNGSSNRQPVGQAFVELIFDNTVNKLGGEYAKYDEIAIKRLVTRDGQSNYYLNGTRCRRKDITDIFLGTGLGPRSYAIIEQGTISRLVEAKPDELRIFLEEAAGISKYKERRRDTENRIRHTRENLERLQDIRDELGKQLDRLKRQSNAAERYKGYKQQEQQLRAHLQAQRWQVLQQKLEGQTKILKEHELKIESLTTQQRQLDNQIETARQQHHQSQQQFDGKQTAYYELGGEVAKIEQTIAHQKQRKTELANDLATVERDLAYSQQQQTTDEQRRQTLQQQLEQLLPKLNTAREQLTTAQQQLQHFQQDKDNWQQQWDQFNTSAAETAKLAHGEQTRIQHLEAQLERCEQHIERLKQEQAQLDISSIQQELHSLQDKQNQAVTIQQQLQQQMLLQQQTIKEQRDNNHQLLEQLEQQRTQAQSLAGRQASLKTLQQAALGQQQEVMQSWLEQHQLSDRPYLLQSLEVEAGWERAVETVLADYLQAFCVESLEPLLDLCTELPEGSVGFISANGMDTNITADHDTLASKVRSAVASVQSLLSSIYIADDLAAARRVLPTLQAHQSVITCDGLWLTKNWLRIKKEEDANAGMLAREAELKQLSVDASKLSTSIQLLEQEYATGRELLSQHEEQREQLQRQLDEVNHNKARLEAELRAKKGRIEDIEKRRGNIQVALDEQQAHLATSQQQLNEARHQWQQAMAAMDSDADKRTQLSTMRDALSQRQTGLQSAVEQTREQHHQLALQETASNNQLQSLTENLQRLQQQQQSLQDKLQSIRQALAESDQPGQDLDSQLKQLIHRHTESEQQMQQARKKLDDITAKLTSLQQARDEVTTANRAAEEERNQLQLHAQELRVRLQTIEEQADEQDIQLTQVLAEIAAAESTPDEHTLQQELDVILQKISRLGAINLMAIEEYKTESERKQYLDTQHADLIEALTTLENAIHKIDKETRSRFKETYDKVNQQFKELFPRLFGGGQAYLDLTGQDLLDTGVTVIARPPGKRNSSIHQLSGGEKALTAVGLVFAIFHLNPSPFCMLDEVDAPLDDANVGRYCELVKAMSQSVQFIFITHNKVTMEMAEQLSGVTMHEPGVSRLVSVDVNQAISLAEEI